MKRILNKETAITLIALVVTIIILLILAGVTIGVATNGTGLFEKAKLATDEYNNSVEKENTELANLSNEIDNYVNGNRDSGLTEEVKNYIDTKLSKNIDEDNLNEKVNPFLLGKYKAGVATIPAASNWSSTSVNVTFTTPFPDTNYTVVLNSAYTGQWWAQTSYSATNKTVNGFKISCYIMGDGSTIAHDVEWIAIPYNNS